MKPRRTIPEFCPECGKRLVTLIHWYDHSPAIVDFNCDCRETSSLEPVEVLKLPPGRSKLDDLPSETLCFMSGVDPRFVDGRYRFAFFILGIVLILLVVFLIMVQT